MSVEVAMTLYMVDALAMALLRWRDGERIGQALMAGIVWPIEIVGQGLCAFHKQT